jgi:hypothetical protein
MAKQGIHIGQRVPVAPAALNFIAAGSMRGKHFDGALIDWEHPEILGTAKRAALWIGVGPATFNDGCDDDGPEDAGIFRIFQEIGRQPSKVGHAVRKSFLLPAQSIRNLDGFHARRTWGPFAPGSVRGPNRFLAVVAREFDHWYLAKQNAACKACKWGRRESKKPRKASASYTATQPLARDCSSAEQGIAQDGSSDAAGENQRSRRQKDHPHALEIGCKLNESRH